MSDLIKEREEKLLTIIDSFEEREKTIREETAKEIGVAVEEVDKKLADEIKQLKQQTEDYMNLVRRNNVSIEGLSDEEKAIEDFSYAKAIIGISTGNWKNAGLEEKIVMEATEKAVDTNTGAQGSYLIPVEINMAKLIKPAIANTVMRQAGTTFWEGLTGDVDIPEATSRPSLNWGSDGVEATAQNISFALQPLRPKEGNMLVKVSNRLLMQQPVAEGVVRDLMMEGVEVGLDNILINGTGSASEPLGILNVSGTNTTDLSNARMTWDDVAAMQTDIMEQDFLKTGGGTLITRPKVIKGIMRQTIAQYSGQAAGAGQPVVVPISSQQAIEDFVGVKMLGTTNFAISSNACKAVVGDFKEFLAGVWGGMRLRSSDVAGTAFTKNQTWLVIFVDVDARAMRPLAFDIASNVKTNF